MTKKHYYFIGIGGISMSALAKLLIADGHTVSGSDINPNTRVPGARVFCGHNAQNIINANNTIKNSQIILKQKNNKIIKNNNKIIKNNQKLIKNTQKIIKKPKKTSNFSNFSVINNYFSKQTATNSKVKNGIDIVVISGAINADNVEITTAKKLKIPIISRGELLALVASRYKTVIAVSGMHGKTTTTEMLAEVLIEAGKNPTVHLGGESRCFNSNLLIGGAEIFVTEACEYQDNFLFLAPDIGVILNIEPEHLDYFKTPENIQKSFRCFAENCKHVVSNAECNIPNAVTFGSGGNYIAKNIKKLAFGYTFDCFENSRLLGNFKLNALGKMNIENALAVISVSRMLHIKTEHIARALANFRGTGRRFDIIQKHPLVIRDYAHHPTEIRASIDAITEFYGADFTVVFQPHTYSRTAAFFDEFTRVLSAHPRVALVASYPAREAIIPGATAHDLYLAIKQTTAARYFASVDEARAFINSTSENLLVLGAGNL